MNRKLIALSLIEVVMFIAIVGTISIILLDSLRTSLNTLPQSEMNQKAINLAQSRMETMIGQIKIQNFATLADICGDSSTLPICTSEPNLTVETRIIPWDQDTRFKQITINVTGTGLATLTTLVAPQ